MVMIVQSTGEIALLSGVALLSGIRDRWKADVRWRT